MTTSARGSGLSKKCPATNVTRSRHRRRASFLENRRDFRQVDSDAAQMRIGERHLHRKISLGGADIDERLIVLPRKNARDVRLAPRLMPVIAARNCFKRAGSA